MRLLPALLIACLLAGCGGDAEEATAPPPAATAKAADAQADVKETFESYNAALLDRDYDGACERLAPESVTKLRENVEKAGIKDAPDDCKGLLAAIYSAADRDASQKKLLDEIVKSAEIDSIKVTGDTAIINWHAEVNGKQAPVSQSARRIDGEWKLVDVTN
jgi:hypothetical protein